MKKYSFIYYFLFMAIVMGAFASMAQNSYGMKLIGYACFGFFLTFIHELIFSVNGYSELSSRGRIILKTELIALSLLALLFGFRNFLIEIPFGKEGILFALTLVMAVTVLHMLAAGRSGDSLTLGMIAYYSALLLFIFTLFSGIVQPVFAPFLAAAGFVLFTLVVAFSLFHRGQGGRRSFAALVVAQKDKSGILMIGFLLIFLYFGLHRASIFPPLYSGEVPPGYVELIRRAESGEEKSTGKKRYEIFDEQYSKFNRRHRK